MERASSVPLKPPVSMKHALTSGMAPAWSSTPTVEWVCLKVRDMETSLGSYFSQKAVLELTSLFPTLNPIPETKDPSSREHGENRAVTFATCSAVPFVPLEGLGGSDLKKPSKPTFDWTTQALKLSPEPACSCPTLPLLSSSSP